MKYKEYTRWMDEEPKNILEGFTKKYRCGGIFRTITGEINTIESVDDKYIYIKCKTKDSNYKIRKAGLENAINILYRQKFVKRSDLAAQSSYNTSLMGIILTIFKYRIHVVKDTEGKGGYKAVLKGVRFIPSGMCNAGAEDWTLMKRAGVKVVMVSYARVRKNLSWYCWCKLLDMFVVLDSGAFTVAMDKLKGKKATDLDVYEYAEYIKKYGDRIISYMNLDVIGDLEATKKNYKILKEDLGLNPIPVWHPNNIIESSDWNGLEAMTKESDIVAIGGLHKDIFKDDTKKNPKKRKLFNIINKLHPDTQFHYLGGSSTLILEDLFLYGQADSTGWLHGRRSGRIYTFKNGRLGHASQKKPKEMSSLEALYFNLVNLTGFEQNYGQSDIPKLSVDKWYPNAYGANFDEEIEKEAVLLSAIKDKMRKGLSVVSESLKPSFLDTQLEWNV